MTNRWKLFTGEYGKVWYDVELYDGSIICECYPNAGTFHTTDGRELDGKIVKYVRKSKHHPMDRRCNMFQAARKNIDQARKYIATARAYKRMFPKVCIEYLAAAERQLIMAELYIK